MDDARNDLSKYLIGQDLVIVDPPRKGLSIDLIDSFKKNKVKKIVYISCNPATMARDLNLLKDEYSFSDVYPVDMFPQTMHVETVVLMSRKDK